MITFLIILFIQTVLLGAACTLTGAILKACLWLFIFLPVGIFLIALGIICCCTFILIPVGIMLLKAGAHIIITV